MKKKTLLLLWFFATTIGFSQSQIDCKQKYEDFETYYRISFNEKVILTQNVREETLRRIQSLIKECPTYNKNSYVYAEEILLKIIHPMNFGTERQQWTQYLTEVYDQYSQNFPETTQVNSQKKIVLSYKNKIYSSEEALKIFDDFFEKNQNYFSTETILIYTDLITQQGKQKYESSAFFKKINVLNQSISAKISELEQKKKDARDTQILKKINTDIESLKIAYKNTKLDKFNCEELSAFFQNDFEENKTNLQWIEQTLDNLSEQKCGFASDFFSKLIHTYYDLEENEKSTFYMGNLAQLKKEYKKALIYFNKSAQLETDSKKKADIYYQIATIYGKNERSQKKEALEKSLENDPKMLTASIQLAQLYTEAEKDCFDSDFLYKTRYYLAIQLLENFIKNSPNYQKVVQKTINDYLEKAPTKKEIKKAKMKGKTIKVDCWINQEFTLP